MNDILDIDIILNRHKYSKIYNINLILITIILIFTYIIFTYKYQNYYVTKGKMIDNKLELLIDINDIKYIKNTNILKIDNKIYTYELTHIGSEIYADENYNNYKYVYIKINNLNNIDNYVYEVKIPKENKILAKYIKDYF